MKITIVGINYRPELTGIALYTAGLAEGLTERGHDVSVLTGLPHYPQWRVAPEYRSGRRGTETIAGVHVRRVKHYVPETPTPVGRVRMEASFARAVIARSWRQPSLVLTVSPALLSAAAVVHLARLRRIPVGVIVQDIYSRGVVETGALEGRAARATARLEAAVLRSATGVSVIHDKFADSLAEIGVDRSAVTVIRNWTHIGTAVSNPNTQEVRSRYGWAPDEIVIVHSGNMGVKQGLENVVDAGKLVDQRGSAGSKIKFVLVGDGNQRSVLETKAAKVRSVELIDPLPEEEFHNVLNAADILLVNEKPGVGEMSVPSKLTSYFICGKPVLAATDPSSATAYEIHVSGAGLLVPPGEPQALLEGARTITADEAMASRLGKLGREYAQSTLSRATAIHRYEEWCWELCRRARRTTR